jgi:hypothetical protein
MVVLHESHQRCHPKEVCKPDEKSEKEWKRLDVMIP